MSLLNSLERGLNTDYTDNGAVSNKTSLSAVLDFFSKAGALRNNVDEAVKLFEKAYAEDKQLAVRALFYLRDIRGGQGERDMFRACFNRLLAIDNRIAYSVVEHIPTFGRWDEVPINENTVAFIKNQLEQDTENMKQNKSVSLLAKWLPSENATSKKSRKDSLKLAELLGVTPRTYRKQIVRLRKHIDLLEQRMSSKEWSTINYENIPSQAHRKHVQAFYRNDEQRYKEYVEAVSKGEKKINSSTLFTYEIYDMLNKSGWGMYLDENVANTAQVMWDNLPDYTDGTNALVMADVSGSMSGRPMSISTSLAVYFAERNKGAFAGYYLTFTDVPTLVKVQGDNIAHKLNYVQHSNVGYNTNLEGAFVAILNAAVKDNTPKEEMPTVLYVISDMQFDSCMNANETLLQSAKRRFNESGYELPHVVFWNVNAGNTSPATIYDNNVTLISGSSQSTFQYAVAGKTPLESMNDILNSERYSCIKL